MQSLRKGSAYNYSYKYYKAVGESIVFDEAMSKLYGADRNGYEIWKESSGMFADHAGITSLRPCYKRNDSKNVLGYIAETKEYDLVPLKEVRELFYESVGALAKTFEVDNLESFTAWIEVLTGNPSTIDGYISSCSDLEDSLRDYIFDDDKLHLILKAFRVPK